MSKKVIEVKQIGAQIEAESPFIACMHHDDHYPKGNKKLGPSTSLSGRQIGQDFSGKDGYSMYHGKTVPGFPVHPHRGFETVTIVLAGLVDHFDSKGAEGRYGRGDVQWFTTGKGCQHSEMFPLVNEESDNKLELFQLWLNLPAKYKFVDPDYKMLWNGDIPEVIIGDIEEESVRIKLIAGTFDGVDSLTATPNSWASSKENHVGIMLIEMNPNAKFTVPAISETLNRNVYFYRGIGEITVDDQMIASSHSVKLKGDEDISIANGPCASYLLLLEGEPINEPVAQYGPFVMNTSEEIKEAYKDYSETEFGGWPWQEQGPVHTRETKRFAKHFDGKEEVGI
jgi:hypothetical protein